MAIRTIPVVVLLFGFVAEAQTGPDLVAFLRPASSSCAATTVASGKTGGGYLTVLSTIYNRGDSPAGGSWTGRYFLSKSESGEGAQEGDIDLPEEYQAMSAIAPGDSSKVRLGATIPSGIAPGAYFLGFHVDANKSAGQGDSSLMNDIAKIPVTIIAPPDLAVTELTAPASAKVGDTITVSGVIENRSFAPSLGCVSVTFDRTSAFADITATLLEGVIAPRTSARFTAKTVARLAGTQVLSATVRGNTYEEAYDGSASSANDRKSVSITIEEKSN